MFKTEWLTRDVLTLLSDENTPREILLDGLEDAGAGALDLPGACDPVEIKQALHTRLMGAKIADLRAKIATGLKDCSVSALYWRKERLKHLLKPGIVAVRLDMDLRRTIPPGEVWIRRSTSGKWAKGRKDKMSRPLTISEMAQRILSEM